jgi:hypothetical protein
MQPKVVLIVKPAVDFDTFIGASHQLLGYNPASAVDQSRAGHCDTERFISCLAALRDSAAPAGLTPNLLSFAHFGFLIVADERDLIDIIECAAGIPLVCADTQSRGILEAIFLGSLAQWRDAVKTGTNPTLEHNVRSCFCQIMDCFGRIGLGNVWKDCQSKPLGDQTFFLEDKRR